MALAIARNICGRTAFARSIAPQLYTRSVTIRAAPTADARLESHDERNMRLKRPLSPHLTIYKPQVTSMLSITHRMTGIALTGYAAILGLGCLVLPNDFSHYISLIESLQLSTPTLVLAKFVLAFPATYHTVNGVRHLFWDLGQFLTIKEVYTTGYAMLGISTVFAAILAAL